VVGKATTPKTTQAWLLAKDSLLSNERPRAIQARGVAEMRDERQGLGIPGQGTIREIRREMVCIPSREGDYPGSLPGSPTKFCIQVMARAALRRYGSTPSPGAFQHVDCAKT
jgi:hypothetical protein